MASMASVLHLHGLHQLLNVTKSSFSQPRFGHPCLSPTKLKLVCRAHNQNNNEQVQTQKGDGLIVDSDDDFQFPTSTGKRSWPELVGEKGEVAVAIIEKENPSMRAEIFTGPVRNLKFVFNRVLVPVDDKGIVIAVPTEG